MKKTYRIVPLENFQYNLYQDDKLVLTGNSSVVHTSLVRRIQSTINAIKQHGGEPEMEDAFEGDVQIVTITWKGTDKGDLRCLEMPAKAWQALDALAESTGSLAAGGPNTGHPSWRRLIRRLAEGDLIIQSPPDAGQK